MSSLALAKAVAHDGLGYAVVLRSSVRDEVASGNLVFRPIGQPALTGTRVVTPGTWVAAFAAMTRAEIIRTPLEIPRSFPDRTDVASPRRYGET